MRHNPYHHIYSFYDCIHPIWINTSTSRYDTRTKCESRDKTDKVWIMKKAPSICKLIKVIKKKMNLK